MSATVLIADDHQIVAEALTGVLGQWYHVLGSVLTLEDLAERLKVESPDVVVLDLSFRQTNALTVLPTLVAAHPRTRFVILTANIARVLVDAARRAGATGFVVKEAGSEELKLAIDAALEGREYISKVLRPEPKPEGGWRKLPKGGVHPGELTPRAMSVLALLHKGMKQIDIASELGLSRQAVEYQIRRAGEVLGVSGATQLVRWYADRQKQGK